MEVYKGTIVSQGSQLEISEDENGGVGPFVQGNIRGVNNGERYFFLKIIQSTPNGDKVIRILQKKIPDMN